ncbi:Metal-dependent hydrolase, beta-lactamase superfamily II [Oceanobacillus limi]|uniref:Metal-dependent hydrolase, beta-lactamase superfamily II n=1 Tax=Oceanobacillus limi TaxID=930131 RepID=A0A1I0AGS7_9BACI|nr:MBL fold metallo-hydrolase [Oceanobacillus limi]SES93379.1 Metal-dependent hydrolase, beta-lactamase superfamily II [Oceanobacillus limi]
MKKKIWLSLIMAVFLVACGQGVNDSSDQELDNTPSGTETKKSPDSSGNSNEKEDETATEETADNNSNSSNATTEKANETLADLNVHYIDVGQADATLLQFEDFHILYDTGDWRGNEVVNYLTSQNVSTIDLVIVSHPDADHVGQLENVVRAFDVGEVWMSGNESSSKTFRSAVEAVLNSDADYHEPQMGETFEMGNMDIEVVYPETISGQTNEESLSVRFTYGDVSFLFTGDADTDAEKYMVNAGVNLDADILQLGHHGSNTSSDPTFIETVSPSVAIYSAGIDNSYGHPHAEVISLFQGKGIDLYGTDVHGTIIVETDGKDYHVKTNKNGTIRPGNSTASDNSDTATDNGADAKSDSSSTENKSGCVDINNASIDELQRIKHIGPARAEELIERRPFQSVNDLNSINGIGPARITDIKEEGIACVQN